jgi:hypothetical protein
MAKEWYDMQSPGLGTTMIEELDKAYQRILEYPEMHQVAFANVRRAVIYRFPYAISYRILPTAIQVVGVLPTRADPKSLIGRAAAARPT